MSGGNGVTPVLDMIAVTKTYGQGDSAVTALSEIDFHADPGEVVLVMGPSGAGKTTFLTIAGALLKPTSGSVTVSGINLIEARDSDLPDIRREKIGFVFQSFNLLEALNATENVTLVMSASRGGSPHRARELLNMMGLSHRLKSLPKNLSGGEKQRVAIARALANNPDLILADEPTANLDAARGREFMLLLKQIAVEMQKAVVIVTHDHRMREIASRIVWLEDGTFRVDVATAKDPVCNRVIEIEGAPNVEYASLRFYFCSDSCKDLFAKEPVRYAGRGG
jgi:putative ABC transport system ATP-binding protein